MRLGLRYISLFVTCSLFILGAPALVRAAALCTPAGGGVAIQLDAAGADLGGQTCNGDLVIDNVLPASHLTGASTLSVTGNLTINTGAELQVIDTPDVALLDVAGNFVLQTGAKITGTGTVATGALASEPVGGVGGSGSAAASCGGSGGGHGGAGGKSATISFGGIAGGLSYDLMASPQWPGSDGGDGLNGASAPVSAGGRGGAVLHISVVGRTTLDGLIDVSGGSGLSPTAAGSGAGGGGSGGAVLVSTGDLVSSATGPTIVADGGAGGGSVASFCTVGAGGGGGRIAVYYAGVNGGALGSPLDAATHLSCLGGPRGAGALASTRDGFAGTCLVAAATPAPVVLAASPSVLGQGSSAVPVGVTGTDFATGAVLEILDPLTGLAATGITINSQVVVPPSTINLILTVDFTADASPAANPKLLRVTNPDLKVSADLGALTVSPAPVISPLVLPSLLRGFSGTITLNGSNFQPGATVNFNPPVVAITGPLGISQSVISIPATVNQAAAAGPVSVTVSNPDGGVTQTAATFNVLSQPQVSAITPSQLTLGQGPVTLTVDGTGFIAASQVTTAGTGLNVVPGSTQFISFNQLTAQVTVDVNTDLSVTSTRDIWVDNLDGGISTPPVAFQLATAQGVNEADIVYGDVAAGTPQIRNWNGFGWSGVVTLGSPIPHTPEWLRARAGLASGELLVASVGAARDLYFQERTAVAGNPPVLTWQPPVGPITVSGVVTPRQPVDVAAVSGAAGERFLAVYGTPGGGLSAQLFGGGAVTVPRTDPACSGVDEVVWVRLAANPAGNEAVLVYAKANGALCALVWQGGVFGNEMVLASPTTLPSLSEMVYDATYWGTAGTQAMVAWGRKGVGQPGVAIWTGTAWSTSQALNALTSALEEISWVRLAASPTSDRVALVNATSGGALVGQFWNGTLWGATFNELPAPLLVSPDRLSVLNGSRPFDAEWSSTLEKLMVVYGVAELVPTPPVEPLGLSWSATGGWTGGLPLPGAADRQEARWVNLSADPSGGDLLASVVDLDTLSAGSGGTLTTYQWDGLAWTNGKTLSNVTVDSGNAAALDYRFAAGPPVPALTAVSYNGSPARIGANATSQVLELVGSGFLNAPTVLFGDPGIVLESVQFISPVKLFVIVSIGAVPPGSYGVTVLNPDGGSASLNAGIEVLAAPAAIHVVDLGVTPCVPTVAGAGACALQDSQINIEVRGTGIVAGATVVFEGSGVDFIGPAVFSVDTGTGEQVLTGAVRVNGAALQGAGTVTVINPDSSTGSTVGAFQVLPFIRVDTVLPVSVGAGAQGVTFTVGGRNFQPGVVFALGSGVFVRNTAVISATQAVLTVDVAGTATLGGHVVSASNVDGAAFTSAGPLFTVLDGITVVSLTPGSGAQGSTVAVAITGSGLATVNTAAEIQFSGAGLTPGNIIATATTLNFDLVISPTAPFDLPRDLTLTRDNGAQLTLSAAFAVAPTPVITGIAPNTVVSGEQGLAVSIDGSGFDPGAVVTSNAGVVVASQVVVSSSRIDVTLDVTGLGGTGSALFVANPNGALSAAAPLTIVAPNALTVSTGSVQISATNALSYDSISVTGGELRIVGDVTVNVVNDVSVTGGAIVFDPDQAYGRLRVGGSLTVGALGTVNGDGTGHPGGSLGTNGAGPGGGILAGQAGVPGGQGGGHGGRGGLGINGTGGASYDLLGLCTPPNCFGGVPLSMGSGGGSAFEWPASGTSGFWRAGGSGGGAFVLDVVGNVTVNGLISANGTNGVVTPSFSSATSPPLFTTNGVGSGGGGGGSVLILAGGTFGGGVGGRIQANGGTASQFNPIIANAPGTGGGGGRVAVYSGVANTFSGTLTCDGGTSNHTSASYIGSPGTCLSAPMTTVTSLTPASVARGGSILPVIQGAGLAVNDTVLFTDPTLTGGQISKPGVDLLVPITASATSPFGTHDIIVRHPDLNQTGGIAFGGLTVAANPTVLRMTPDHLTDGVTGAVTLAGSLLDAAGGQVSFLRSGVVTGVTATVNIPASNPGQLSLQVTVPAGTATGGYDVRVVNPNGGSATLHNGFVVTAAGANVPAPSAMVPEVVPAGATDFPVTLFGYDFGVPGAFVAPSLSAAPPHGTAVTLRLDPAGCPGPGNANEAACEPAAGALQHINALVTTTAAVGGELVDVVLTQGAAVGTLPGGLSISAAPTISGLAPVGAVGSFTLTVSGSNFQPGAIVSVDNANVQVGPTVAVGADLTVAVTVPVDLATVNTTVRVKNPDGGEALSVPWPLNPTPVVGTLSPISSVTPGTSGTINIGGQFFHPNASVALGAGVNVSAPVFIDSNTLQVVVSVDTNAVPGSRTVSVTNHVSRVPGELVGGFTVGRKLVLQLVSPNAVGVGAGTDPVVIFQSTFKTKPAGLPLLIAGQEFSSAMDLGDVSFDNSGVDRLNRDHDVYSSSDPASKNILTGFRATTIPGGPTVTSASFMIKVDPGTSVGPGNLSISNPDGSSSSIPFTINPAPVIASVTPNKVTQGELVDLVIRGFGFDPVNPQVCFGDSCQFSAQADGVTVLDIRPQHPNRVDVTVRVSNTSLPSSIALKVLNSDGGRVTDSAALEMVSLFSISGGATEVVQGGVSPSTVLTGSGFNSLPSLPQLSFLLPDGTVDANLSTQVDGPSVGATSLSYTVSATPTAAPGWRTLVMVNGDGASLKKEGFLLVTRGTGPTIGGLLVPAGASGFRSAVVGQADWYGRVIRGVRLRGVGFSAGGLSLSFGDPSVTAANLMVIDDTTASFDLTLGSGTVPGAIDLTITTASGSDVRAGVLTVVTAPLISSLRPGHLEPGTSNVSVTATGAGFDPNTKAVLCRAMVIPGGAVGVRHSITAPGFVPSAATVEMLLPSGVVDTAITNGTAVASANQPDVIDLSFDVGAAVPGLRSLRITNGTGSVLTVPEVLVVTGVVDGGGGFRLDVNASACDPEIVAAGSLGNGRTLTGTGFVETPSAISVQFLLPSGAVDGNISASASPLAGDSTRMDISIDVQGAASTGYRTLRVSNGDGAVLEVPDYLLVTPTGTTNGAGNVPFISLRDFDGNAAGNQVSWFGVTLLRAVADVGVLASGDYYLQLTGSDGGAVRHLLPVPVVSLGTPAKLAYLSGLGTDGLHVRDWLGTLPVQPPLKSDPFGGGALPHNGSLNDLWTVLRANPMNPGEYSLAVGKANTVIFAGSGVTLYNLQPGSGSWTEVTALGTLESGLAQGFDVAYEQAGSGRGLMVYGLGNGLGVKYLLGAGAPVTGVVSVAGDPSLATSGRPVWVRLIPQRHTQRILVMYQTDTQELQALIWDGSAAGGAGAFISQYDGMGTGPLPGSAPPPIVSWGVNKRGFDGAWESASGRAVAFYGVGGGNGVHAVTWDPATGAWGTETVSVGLNTGTGPVFLEAKAAPEGDRISVLTSIPRAGERALAYHFFNNGWEGLDGYLNFQSAFSNGSSAVVDRNFDMGWDNQGRLIALYTTATGGNKLDTRVWDPADILNADNGWGVAVEQPLIHASGRANGDTIIPVYVDVVSDPDSNELLAMVVDEGGGPSQLTSDALTTTLLRWNGFGWSERTLLDGNLAHWAGKGIGGGGRARIYGNTARVVYQDDLLPPQAVTLSPTGVAGASSVEVKWTVPGDNGASGQAGGYDIRWASVQIVDDGSVPDCAVLTTQICFSDANQVANPPLPGAPGTQQTLNIDFGTSGAFWVALKTGDRPNRMGVAGKIIPWRNVSAMSNSLMVTPLAVDTIPPEAIADLAVVPGANPESMVVLTWTGVGDDGGVPNSPPVLGYDVRISPLLNISEVGGNTNFFVPFDQVTRSEIVAPAIQLGTTRGVQNSYTVTGLDPSVTYFFAVKGLDEDPTRYAPISNVVSLTTAQLTPGVVDDLIVAARTTNSVTLAWTARGGGPTSYDLRFAADSIVDDFAAVVDCAALPAGQICMSRAARVLNTPVPAASGVRQAVLAQGLAPATTYHFALTPVRYQNVGGVFTRVAPALATVTTTTVADPGGASVQPSSVGDLMLVDGSVRTHEAGLRWTAPSAPDTRASRYELLWSTQPLSSAPAGQIQAVWVPILPAVSGVLQEFTLGGLPENAVLHVALRSYSANGVVSALSNEVTLHTALRPGVNAVSVPGNLFNADINSLFGPLVGTCPSTGTPVSGSGPVAGCGNGEVPRVTAFRWDPAVGASGDFVAVNVTDTVPDPLLPGEGVFLLAAGTQAILNGLEGFDLASFGRVAIPAANAALIANPYRLPVALADLRIVGIDGTGGEVYNQTFAIAASGGVVNPELEFYTEVNQVVTRVPVTLADELLPYQAYFIQLGGTPDPTLNYFVEVPHP